jgi:ribosomal RNA methyltransferase Nop2
MCELFPPGAEHKSSILSFGCGLSVNTKDPSIKVKRGYSDLEKLSKKQKQLLLAGIDCVDGNKDNVIVYCTCSISLEENECVVE